MKVYNYMLILVLIIFINVMCFFIYRYFVVSGPLKIMNNKILQLQAEYENLQNMCSELPVTRMEFLMVLGKKLDLEQDYSPVNLKDVNDDSAYLKYLSPFIKEKLVSGYSDNTFRPNDLITRNEAEMIVARSLKRPVPLWYKNSPYLTQKQMFDMLSEITENKNRRTKW